MRLRWIVASLSLALSACSNEPLDVAPNVDLSRFQGQWFEIAKLPRWTQANCTGTTAFYKVRDDGGLSVVNQCHLERLDGETKTSLANVDTSGEGAAAKLRIDVGGFYGDYWILEVGEHYEYAVVGVPSRDYLWILSRTPALDKPALDGIITRTRAKKFDTSHLEFTVQAP